MIGLLLFIAMEAAWIAMAAMLVDGAVAGSASLWPAAVVLVYPLAIFATGWLARIARPVLRYPAAAVSFLAVAALAVLLLLPGFRLPADGQTATLADWLLRDLQTHRAIALVVLALFCWLRGALLAGREVDGHAVALGFQIGFFALLAIHGLAFVLGLSLPAAALSAAVFVGAGLLSLWHRRAGSRSGGGRARRDPAAAVVGLSLVMAFGGAVMLAVNPGVLQAALDLLAWAWGLVAAAFLWLFSLFPETEPVSMEMPEQQAPPAFGERPRESPLFQPMKWMRLVFGVIFIGGLGVFLAVILLTNLRDLIAWLRQRVRQTPGIAYDRSQRRLGETLRLVWRALMEAAAAWFARRRARIRGLWSDDARPPLERRLYGKLSAGLTGRGLPRKPQETPLEYARRLRAEPWPGQGGDLQVLTHAYMANRYGGLSHRDARLRRLWTKVRRSLNKVPYRNDQDSNASPR